MLGRPIFASVCAVLMLGACTPKSPQAEVETEVREPAIVVEPPVEKAEPEAPAVPSRKTAASLPLDKVVALVEGCSIGDAYSLEQKINDPQAQLNTVDIDEDGQTDFVDVVEDRDGDKMILELRAVSSSKKPVDKVLVATVELHIENKKTIIVDATYADALEHDATVYHHELPATFEKGELVVEGRCFFFYAFVLGHAPYLGRHYATH